MKKDRLVDPVHFFNSEGVPMLTLKHLQERNDALQKDNERLMRLLRAQVAKNNGTGDEPDHQN